MVILQELGQDRVQLWTFFIDSDEPSGSSTSENLSAGQGIPASDGDDCCCSCNSLLLLLFSKDCFYCFCYFCGLNCFIIVFVISVVSNSSSCFYLFIITSFIIWGFP
jgi:hypothetical protein